MSMEIVWKIPSERAYDRLEELEAAVKNLPDSPLVPLWEKEIKGLQGRLP